MALVKGRPFLGHGKKPHIRLHAPDKDGLWTSTIIVNGRIRKLNWGHETVPEELRHAASNIKSDKCIQQTFYQPQRFGAIPWYMK